ncbi:MAG: gamma-butyrobetaine hydroxylase-like domain-containing protein [Opitutales bacterium]
MDTQAAPEDIQLIGQEVAVRWPDGKEDYFSGPFLRARSPSAENVGEVDILGVRHGGADKTSADFANVAVTGWKHIGNYAVAFAFSDGHRTGIYSWPYLRKLGEEVTGG